MEEARRRATETSLGKSTQFRSVLFPHPAGGNEAPEFFRDLNLDQIVDTITRDWEEFELAPFFFAPPGDLGTILYRQEIMRDVEKPAVMQAIGSFTKRMREMRRYLNLAEKLSCKEHREGWFLASTRLYCEAIEDLARELSAADLASRGLLALRQFLAGYGSSEAFVRLAAESRRLADELSAVRYAMILQGRCVTVCRHNDEIDYSAALEACFSKFRQGAVKDYRLEFRRSGMNRVEEQVLERVAKLHPDTFRGLAAFCAEHAGYPNATIVRFYREIQFFVAYLKHVGRLRAAGLPFCYPQLSDSSKEECVQDAFDLALAHKLTEERRPVVRNGFFLSGRERVFVVSGPNQGGKTTFARMFGQLHYLAALGCPVPGTEARLFLVDRLFTHFEREEDIATLRGKLADELVRLRRMLDWATPNSLLILNEVFTSTTLRDGLSLGRRVLDRISELDVLCVFVTFLDELATFNEKTVSMVSTVEPEDPAVRTYRLERRPADGLAYALAIAEKHGVTYRKLKERIKA